VTVVLNSGLQPQKQAGSLCGHDRLYIGGDRVVPPDGVIADNIDPAMEQPWTDVTFGGPRKIDHAVAAAPPGARAADLGQ
jgi:aldehyde dehydrogenase (NAD+)